MEGLEPTNEKIVFNVTKTKLEQIDQRARSSGSRSRSDYVRKLIDKDIETAKEVSTKDENTKE